jgi:hypothetical protein
LKKALISSSGRVMTQYFLQKQLLYDVSLSPSILKWNIFTQAEV